MQSVQTPLLLRSGLVATFLPVVERELRMRARRRSTWRFRIGSTFVALVFIGIMLLFGDATRSPAQFGAGIFELMRWLAFGFCLTEGARTTADCLSEEKRGGTLGLLFLTDLRGFDVVLGKLVATSLNSFYVLLATLPPLALTLLFGGVTGGEFWRTVLALLTTLFLSLAVGMLVSAIQWEERKTWSLTLLLMSALAILAVPGRLVSPVLGWASPTSALLAASDARFSANAGPFWLSLLVCQGLAWACLITACVVVPRAWQEISLGGEAQAWRRWTSPSPSLARRPQRGAPAKGRGADPVSWMASRRLPSPRFLWILVGAFGLFAVAALTLGGGPQAAGIVLACGAFAVNFFVTMMLAALTCYALAEMRDSGAFELMMATPLAPAQIIEGHFEALRRLFAQPVLALVSLEMLLLAGHSLSELSAASPGGPTPGAAYVVVASGLVVFVLDLYAVARFGMWMAMVTKRPATALLKTVLYVLILPLGFLPCCGFWPVMAIVKDVLFINYGRDQLRNRFRQLVTEGVVTAAPADDWIAPASTRPGPNLPRVNGES